MKITRPAVLPKNAALAFEGKIFRVWQWPQKMFDGSVQTFERLERPNTAQVIAAVGDKIILQIQEQPHRQKSFVSIPGGRCGWEEDPLEAAKRELLEETGYESDEWALFSEKQPYNKIIWTLYTFIARDCRKNAEPTLDAGEKIANKLISFEEFLALADNPLFHDTDFINTLLRARADIKFRDAFKGKIFSTPHSNQHS